MEQIHVFLKNELDRLKISAAQAARDANEPDSQGLRDVLSGRKRLTADLLGSLVAATGLDALYVLTGVRSAPVAKPLPADEQMWLDCYREWSPEVKKRELRRAMGVAPEGAAESPQAAPTPNAPTYQIGGAHSQHNSGDNAVQIGGNSGGVTQNIRAPVRGGVAGGNIYRKK